MLFLAMGAIKSWTVSDELWTRVDLRIAKRKRLKKRKYLWRLEVAANPWSPEKFRIAHWISIEGLAKKSWQRQFHPPVLFRVETQRGILASLA